MSPPSSSLLILLVFSTSSTLSALQLDTLVHLPAGDVQGKILQSRAGNDFASFEGVPYAEKPVRWMPPEPKASWEGALDCTAPGPMCLQPDFATQSIIGSEDCLSLNIYTTATGTSQDIDEESLPSLSSSMAVVGYWCRGILQGRLS
eukprot:TRINITY_DN13513_c0_g1_i1.p1 TRINITY_DN13513_c0_g1~~TRINITY_DN13513_c0_g1_i1.p1  ORF type:complete len:161 (-),score=34.17 TRINITY_DN13513_c0_g1_i1:33-473(-)